MQRNSTAEAARPATALIGGVCGGGWRWRAEAVGEGGEPREGVG